MEVCIILLINFINYFRTLRFGYVSDDIATSKRKYDFKNKFDKIYTWIVGEMRWNKQIDHLLTMLIHSTICVLIYFAFGSSNLSFIAALLYSVNPANTQASIWIAGRGYTLPLFLILLTLAVPILSPVTLIACSFFTIGFLAPLVLIGSPAWKTLVFLFVGWLIHLKKFRHAVHKKTSVETVTEDKTFHWKKLILATKTVGFYLSLCIIPFKITFYHSFLQSCAGNPKMKRLAYKIDKFFFIGLFSVVGWGVYWYINGWDMVTYGMFWYFITIAPFSNLKRVQQEISERYAYLPNVGVMLALASLIHTYPVLITIFITMYITKLQAIMGMYKDDYWLVERAVAEDPNAWYAWHVRGHKRWSVGSYKEALILWVMAKMISPTEFKILFNIAVVLRIIGNHKECEAYLRKAKDCIIPGQEEQAKIYFKQFAEGKYPLII